MKWRKKIDKKILKERTGTLCIRTHCTNSSNHIMMHKNDRRPWTHFLLSVSRFEMKIGNYWKPLFLPSCVSNPRLSDQNYLGLSLWYTPASTFKFSSLSNHIKFCLSNHIIFFLIADLFCFCVCFECLIPEKFKLELQWFPLENEFRFETNWKHFHKCY